MRYIPEYENYYMAGEDGTIMSVGRYVQNHSKQEYRPGHVLKQTPNPLRNNYRSVMLSKEGKAHRMWVHKLIALTYPEICGEYFEGAEIDHIDGNNQNNAASNLRWTDRTGNMANPNTRKKMKDAWSEERREKQRIRMKTNNPVWYT